MNGVPKESPLVPKFADYYMFHQKDEVLADNKASNPSRYFRFVNDTFCVFKNGSHISHSIRRLKNK